MKKSRGTLEEIVFFLVVVLYVGGAAFKGYPSDPDHIYIPRLGIGAFLLFALWSLSTLSWGRVATSALGLEELGLVSWMALGTAGASLTAFALGCLHLIGPSKLPVMLALLMLGPLLSVYLSRRTGKRLSFRWEGLRRLSRSEAVLLAIVVLALLPRVFKCFKLLCNADEMSFHLVGPRLWSDAGAIGMTPSHPPAMECSYWEYLFIWGNALLTEADGRGLIEGAFFGQWVHTFFGFLGSLLAIYALALAFTKDRAWSLLAVLAASATGTLRWTSWFAKNEFGIALWTLTGALLLLRPMPKNRARHAECAAGALFGLSVGGMFSSAFTVAPLVAIAAWRAWSGSGPRERGRRALTILVRLSAAFWVALLPVIALRWYATGNPIFPMHNELFQSPWVSRSWSDWMAGHVEEGWGVAWRRIGIFTLDSPLIVFFALAPMAWLLRRRKGMERVPHPLWCAGVGAFVLYSLTAGRRLSLDDGTAGLVYLGPGALLICATAVVLAKDLCEALIRSRPARQGVLFALTAVVLHQTAIWWKLWPSYAASPIPEVAIRRQLLAGDCKTWLRLNTEPGDLILSTGDRQIYYISHLRVKVIPDDPKLDQLTRDVADPREIVRRLRAEGARYVLDVRRWDTRFYGPVSERLSGLFHQYPSAVAYHGRESLVVDLAKLDSAMAAARAENAADRR